MCVSVFVVRCSCEFVGVCGGVTSQQTWFVVTVGIYAHIGNMCELLMTDRIKLSIKSVCFTDFNLHIFKDYCFCECSRIKINC